MGKIVLVAASEGAETGVGCMMASRWSWLKRVSDARADVLLKN